MSETRKAAADRAVANVGNVLSIRRDRTEFRAASSKRLLRRVVLALIALLLVPNPVRAQDQRTIDPVLPSNERAVPPVTVSAIYTAEARANVRGGIARGERYLDNIDVLVGIDADRLIGWRGARIFIYGLYNNGTAFSGDLVGDMQTVSNIETGVRAARLFEAWVEQQVGANASIKVGLYNLNSEFDTTPSGALFLLSSHGIGPDFSQTGSNGPSIFPVTSLAVRGDIKLGEHWLMRAAILDGVPGDPDRAGHMKIKLSRVDGALVSGEINYFDDDTKMAIGGWGYSAGFDEIAVSPSSAKHRGNKGMYFLVDRRLRAGGPAVSGALSGWLRLGVANTRFNRVGSYVGGGLVETGIVSGRDADQVGLSFAAVNFGERYRRVRRLIYGADRREIVLEATYNAVLRPWLSVQPDLQYVVNPGGESRLRDALVLGLRVRIGR